MRPMDWSRPIHVLVVASDRARAEAVHAALAWDGGGRYVVSDVAVDGGGLAAAAVGEGGQAGAADVVVLALDLGDDAALETFLSLRQRLPAAALILVAPAAHRDVATAALRAGAQDIVLSGPDDAFPSAELDRAVERIVLQREVAASWSSLANLVDGSADGILVVDREGRIRYANLAAGALFQRPVEELIGGPFGTPVEPGQRTELDVPLRAGAPRTVELHASAVVWHGAPCLALVLRDISERKRASARIEHLNEVLAAIRGVDQLIAQEKDPTRLVRRACDLLVAARGFAGVWLAVDAAPGLPATFGLCGGDAAFRTVADQVREGRPLPCLPHGHAETVAGSGLLLAPGPGCTGCDLCQFPGGGKVAVVLLRHHGTIHGSMGVAVPPGLEFDRTDGELLTGVAADLALALHDLATERQRQSSEAQYRTIFDSVNDVILVLDPESGRTLDANRRVEAVFGWTPAEFCRLSWADWSTGDPPYGPTEAGALLRRAADGTPTTFEWRGRHRDGRTLWTEVSLQSAVLAGEPRVLAVVRDVTARREMEEQLAQADRLAGVGLLAAGVAHEINNPLTYILYNLEEIAEDLPRVASAVERLRGAVPPEWAGAALGAELSRLDPARMGEHARGAGEALQGALRVRDIVRDLGTFARVEAQGLQAVSLDQVADRAIDVTYNEIRHRARLVRTFGAPPPVLASEGRLGQVFLNLLINAVHALPEGRVSENEIRVRTWHEGDHAVFEIQDTGCGIPAAHLPRVFQPFFTTKDVGVGSGLGLAICRNIVGSYGGRIELDSVEGRGTTVLVRLPLATTVAAAASAEEAEPGPDAASGAGRAGARGRFLVVDDEPRVGGALARLLSAEHDVVLVHSAGAAQKLLQRDAEFDGILCDLMMPDRTGMDLFEWLRDEHPALARATIFITGGAFTPGAQQFLSEVPNPVLEKPLDPARLRAVLGDLRAA